MYNVTLPEPAIIADPGVSPADGTTVEGVQAFTFGFKSATGSLEELELDIYLGENTGENRDYAGHLGINLPAGSEAVASWVEQVVEGYGELDSKFHGLLAAAGYVVDAGDEANKQALKENIFYTAGDDGTGTWTIKLDTAVLGEEKVEFLVTVRDDAGAQWGNNNYVSYPNDVKAFLYNVTLPEPAITMTAGEPTIEDGKVTLAVTTKNTGADYENARYGIKVNAAGVEGDTISVSYGDEGLTFNLTRVEGSDDFIGYFGPADGFTITKGWDVTTTFTVDFGTAASDRTVKVDAWVNQGAEPAEEDAVAKMEQLEITIPAAEPEEYHTYKFKIEDKADEYIVSDGLVDPTDADFAGMTPVKLSIVVDSEKDKAYGGNVRVAPVNADGLQLWAKDTAGKWHDINQVGWGPSEGFPIDTTLVTDVYVIATAAFDGTVTLELVDVTGDYGAVDNIIISQEVAVKAVVDAIAQALAAVNAYLTPESYNYSGAPEALEEHLATLGLDVGTESDYAALDKTATGGKNRKTAVFYDLNNNKPAEGYDLSTLTTYFNDMVATRLVTEESMDLVNNAENTEALNGISFVTMLLDRFGAVSYATHSDIPVTEKIATLQGLVDRYNSLDEAGKAAVLQKLLEKRPTDGYARSQATLDALDNALDEVVTTYLTMSAADVTATTGEEFTMAVTAQGTVADADKEHKVRFYGVIPGLTADDIEFAAISGGTPEIVTDATERSYAGANHDDIVLAWGPKGGFPLKSYDYSQGVTTEFKATIKKAGTYTVKFVFYDIDGQKRLNGEDETATITVTDLAVTSLTMSAANVDATTDEQFTMAVTAQGTVADADKEHKVRFYGVIPGLTADDIEFAAISGGTPEIVTDATERSYAGANHDDIVLAWGPKGGFPLKSYDYSQGVTTEFKATIKKAGTYTVKFVFYDIDGQKRLNGEDETATITVTGS